MRAKSIHRRVLYASALVLTASLALAAGFHARSAYRFLGVFQEVWRLARANYVEPVDEDALLRGAYQGMLSSLDAGSGYLNPEQSALMRMTPGPASAGLELLPSAGIPVVVRVKEGGPAAKAGLEIGDQIWRIGDKPTRQLPLPLLEQLLRGEAGTVLPLTVLDGSQFKRRQVEMTLAIDESSGYQLELVSGPIIRLTLSEIARVDTDALRRELQSVLAERSQAPVVVDLRGVVGTQPEQVTRLAGVMIPGGPLLRLVPREGRASEVSAPRQGTPLLTGRAVFALVDGTTAGVGEALAALLAEKIGARICGRSTYGLGAVPEIIPLEDGSSVMLTTHEIQTMAGRSWAADGLEPDKILASVGRPRTDDGSADRLLEEALEWIRSGDRDASDEERAQRPAA
ncbi:MAG: PDZ domain-containing protein [Acidobacteriota bacterium]|nr:MAG: PDZ domain-containing protein [Acidobacteriota bacterium]